MTPVHRTVQEGFSMVSCREGITNYEHVFFNSFVGISQANRALTKPSSAKIRSKKFPLNKNACTLLYLIYI